MAETGKYEEFRKLLKDGIGTRTQKEFADATGIARETISRLLNKEKIPQPSMDTLERIGRNIANCTLNDLFESCGYPRVSLEENVSAMEHDIMEGVNTYSTTSYVSVDEFAANIDSLWITTGKFRPIGKEMSVDDADNPADYYRDLAFTWKHEDLDCECDIRMYYVKGKKGNVVFTSFSFRENKETTDWAEPEDSYTILRKRHVSHSIVVKRKTEYDNAEEALLRAIFGEGEQYIDHTELGVGFQYAVESEKDFTTFKAFLDSHASSFCTSKENTDLYEYIESFSGGHEDMWDHLVSQDLEFSIIVAQIMKHETGLDYDSYPAENGHYIMYPCSRKHQMNPPTENLYALSQYAKELNIPKFGSCYSEFKEEKVGKVYNTADCYLYFK